MKSYFSCLGSANLATHAYKKAGEDGVKELICRILQEFAKQSQNCSTSTSYTVLFYHTLNHKQFGLGFESTYINFCATKRNG